MDTLQTHTWRTLGLAVLTAGLVALPTVWTHYCALSRIALAHAGLGADMRAFLAVALVALLLPALAVAQDAQPITGSLIPRETVPVLPSVRVDGMSVAYLNWLSTHPQTRIDAAGGCHVLGDLFLADRREGIAGRLDLIDAAGRVVARTRTASGTGLYRLVVPMPAGVDSMTLRERTPAWPGAINPAVVCKARA